MINALGREISEYIDGYGKVVPFIGAFATRPGMHRYGPTVKAVRPGESKLLRSLEEAFRRIPIRDGMTFSFHHHFRNGNEVVNMVLAMAAKLGIRGLNIALSAIFPVHALLIDHVKTGVVTGLDTNYMSGPVARAVP